VGAQDAFEFGSNAEHRVARSLVAGVGVKADAEHVPGFEGVGEHQEFGFGVGGRADSRLGEPGVADLADVGVKAAVVGMAFGPGPMLDIIEAGGADDGVVAEANGGVGDGGAGVAPFESGCDVSRHGVASLWDGSERVEGRIGGCGGEQRVNVQRGERFEAHVFAGEDASFHGFQYAAVGSFPTTVCDREQRVAVELFACGLDLSRGRVL
jgi:hypothetical protein